MQSSSFASLFLRSALSSALIIGSSQSWEQPHPHPFPVFPYKLILPYQNWELFDISFSGRFSSQPSLVSLMVLHVLVCTEKGFAIESVNNLEGTLKMVQLQLQPAFSNLVSLLGLSAYTQVSKRFGCTPFSWNKDTEPTKISFFPVGCRVLSAWYTCFSIRNWRIPSITSCPSPLCYTASFAMQSYTTLKQHCGKGKKVQLNSIKNFTVINCYLAKVFSSKHLRSHYSVLRWAS